MTSVEALKILLKKNPKLKVLSAAVYDKKAFLFEATESPTKVEDDAYYIVDAKNGKVYNYSPAGDYDKFFDAIENHQIKIEKPNSK